MSDGEGEGERVAPEMIHVINVTVMDSPATDKGKTLYSAETENMDSVSINKQVTSFLPQLFLILQSDWLIFRCR